MNSMMNCRAACYQCSCMCSEVQLPYKLRIGHNKSTISLLSHAQWKVFQYTPRLLVYLNAVEHRMLFELWMQENVTRQEHKNVTGNKNSSMMSCESAE